MNRRRLAASVCAVILLVTLATWWFAFDGQRPDLILWPSATPDERLAILERPITFQCSGEPFAQAVVRAGREAGVQVEVDPSLIAGGRSDSRPVECDLHEQPLAALLECLLKQAEQPGQQLIVGVLNDRLRVTDRAAWLAGLNNYVSHSFALDALLSDGESYAPEELFYAIASVVSVDSWNSRGGVGDLRRVPGGMVVTQTLAELQSITALLAALASGPSDETSAVWIDPPPTEANLRVDRALKQTISLDFSAVPLDEALRQWSDELRIPIHLDRRALEAKSLSPRLPLTARLNNIQFGSALRLLLGRPYNLTYRIDHGGLWIEPWEVAERSVNASLRMYPVADLQQTLRLDPSSGHLEHAIQSRLLPYGRNVGGAMEAYELPGALLVLRTAEGHQYVEWLLDELRQRQAVDGSGPARHWSRQRRKIEQALSEPVQLQMVAQPLGEVVERLATQLGINVHLDAKALNDVGLALDERVTLVAEDERLGAALRRMLEPLDLRLTVRDETLIITTPEASENDWELRVYRVARLLHPPGTPLHPEATDPYGLGELIETCVAPQSWDTRNGPSSLTALGNLLPIAQTREVHEETQRLLDRLTHAFAGDATQSAWTVGITEDEYARFAQRFRRPSSLEFQQRPLAEVLDEFSKELQVPVEFVADEMGELGFTAASPVTADLRQMELGPALRRLLDLLDVECRWDGKRLRLGAYHQPLVRIHRLAWLKNDDLGRLPELLELCALSDDQGTRGEVFLFHDLLLVGASLDRQYRVDRTLRRIESFVTADEEPPAPVCLDEPAMPRVVAALEQPVSLTAFAMPVREVREALATSLSVPLDVEATEGDWLEKIPLTCVAVNVPLGLLLDRLQAAGMQYEGLYNRLLITPRGRSLTNGNFWLYHVAALEQAWRPLANEPAGLPLPWHLRPSPNAFGPLHFGSVSGKTVVRDTLRDILGRASIGERTALTRLGPAVLVHESEDWHRASASTLSLLKRQVKAIQDNRSFSAEPLLDRTITLTLNQVPLDQALRQFAEQEDLSILVEKDALPELPKDFTGGIYRVSGQFADQPLRQVLPALLPNPERLQVIQVEETLILTSREKADQEFVWRTFDIRPLARIHGERGELRLAQLVSQVAPLSWLPDEPPPVEAERGGFAVEWGEPSGPVSRSSLGCYPELLVIRQTRANQRAIEAVLRELAMIPNLAEVRLQTDPAGRLSVVLPALDEPGRIAFINRLIQQSRDPQPLGTRLCATILLSRMERPTPELLEWLRHELKLAAEEPWNDEQRVLLLCQAVRNCGDQTAEATAALQWLLNTTTDRLQRDMVIRALVHCGPRTINRLDTMLGTDHPDDHWAAIRELRESGTRAAVALPYLMRLFEVLDATQLLQAMASFDESGREAHRVLDRWSQDSDVFVRRRARELRPQIRGLFGDPIE